MTPAAISRRRASSGEIASGNSVVTIAKKASGCTSCPLRRNASVRSLSSTRRAASSTEAPSPVAPATAGSGAPAASAGCVSSGKRQLQTPHTRRRDRQLVMRGRQHESAARQLLVDECTNELLPLTVEIGGRLVEQPERHHCQSERRQRDAPLLSRRKSPRRPLTPGRRAYALQRARQQSWADAPAHPDPEAQILERAQVGLERRLVPDIDE